MEQKENMNENEKGDFVIGRANDFVQEGNLGEDAIRKNYCHDNFVYKF